MTANLDEPIAISMPARVWSAIDGGMDNATQTATEDGDDDVAEIGRAIRHAGWDQVPWVDGEWPPDDQVITITLTRAQWTYALTDARETGPVYTALGDDESAELGRRAIAAIEPHL